MIERYAVSNRIPRIKTPVVAKIMKATIFALVAAEILTTDILSAKYESILTACED
jgi:hypothetical protein